MEAFFTPFFCVFWAEVEEVEVEGLKSIVCFFLVREFPLDRSLGVLSKTLEGHVYCCRAIWGWPMHLVFTRIALLPR